MRISHVAILMVSSTLCVHAQQPATPPPIKMIHMSPPQHPATDAQLKEYFDLLGVNNRALTAQMVARQKAVAPAYYPASYWKDMEAELGAIDYVSMYVPIYRQYLSESDLEQILVLYRSDSGKHLMVAQRQMLRQLEPMIQQKGMEIAHVVYARHKTEIDAAKAQANLDHGGTAK